MMERKWFSERVRDAGKLRRAIVELLHSLNEKSGRTFIIVTHNPEVAEATHRIIRMRDGLVEVD